MIDYLYSDEGTLMSTMVSRGRLGDGPMQNDYGLDGNKAITACSSLGTHGSTKRLFCNAGCSCNTSRMRNGEAVDPNVDLYVPKVLKLCCSRKPRICITLRHILSRVPPSASWKRGTGICSKRPCYANFSPSIISQVWSRAAECGCKFEMIPARSGQVGFNLHSCV